MHRPRKAMLIRLGIVAAAVLISIGCNDGEVSGDFVARLGDRVYTREELSAALESLTVPQDSAEASGQILEQWISDELLYREAIRLGLRNDEAVQRLIRENERSVLVSSLLSRMYSEDPGVPDEQELETYYEQHKNQLRLSEPFVRIRYLVIGSADSARLAMNLLESLADSVDQDSLWHWISERFSEDPGATETLSASFYPESRLLSTIPGLHTAVRQLEPGQVLSPFELDERYHVVQLVQRLPVGTIPEMKLLENQLRDRIAIENRKQIYARQVQRLRNEALAREELEIR